MLKVKLSKLLLIFTLMISDASALSETFQAEIDSFCALYNPKNWSHLDDDSDLYSIYEVIETSYRKTIKSREVIEATSGTLSAERGVGNPLEYYEFVTRKLSILIEKKWQCSYFDDFYMPWQKVTHIKIESVNELQIDLTDQNNIIIEVSQNGQIYVNDSQLLNSSIDLLKRALTINVQGKSINDVKLFIHVTDSETFKIFSNILTAAHQIGITDVLLFDRKTSD